VAVTFVADETAVGTDFNTDGDTSDLVLRWFRGDCAPRPPGTTAAARA
jgi:hypothetical protein